MKTDLRYHADTIPNLSFTLKSQSQVLLTVFTVEGHGCTDVNKSAVNNRYRPCAQIKMHFLVCVAWP